LSALSETGDRELNAEVQYWLGECYFKLKNYKKAITEFLKVSYLFPDISLWGPTAEFRAAQTYTKLNNSEEAEKLFLKIISEQGKMSTWGEAAQKELDHLKH
jgi:TolA-binding protein